jgi:hypothetical protein
MSGITGQTSVLFRVFHRSRVASFWEDVLFDRETFSRARWAVYIRRDGCPIASQNH